MVRIALGDAHRIDAAKRHQTRLRRGGLLERRGRETFSKPDGKRPSASGRKSWKVYIHTEAHYRAAVKYVVQNQPKEGKPQQRWSFVVPLDGAPCGT